MSEFKGKYQEQVRKDLEATEQGRESTRGHNTHVVVETSRHGQPFKDPETGRSLDKITDTGLATARQKGKQETIKYAMVAGSKEVERARETGAAYREGVDETGIAEVINAQGAKDSKLRKFGIYAMTELDPWKNPSPIFNPIMAEAKKLVNDGKLDPKQVENWAFDKFLHLPAEELQAQNVATRREVAALLAHRLTAGDRMSKRLFEGLDLKIENITHAPNIDAFFLEIGLEDILRDENGEYHGFTPGETFTMDFYRDETGKLIEPLKIKFRGKTYEINKSKLDTLSSEGRELLTSKLEAKN